MTDLVLVRPRHGLILDGIPTRGAQLERALAETWIADQLVERVPVLSVTTTITAQKRSSK